MDPVTGVINESILPTDVGVNSTSVVDPGAIFPGNILTSWIFYYGWALLLRAAVTMLCFIIMIWVLNRLLLRLVPQLKSPQHRVLLKLSTKTIKSLLLVMGVLSTLNVLGVYTTSFLGGLGLTGFALTYASREVFTNTIAGFMIMIYQPVRIGCYISVGQTTGRVTDINLRYTEIQADNVRILVPNGNLITRDITIHEEMPEPSALADANEHPSVGMDHSD